MAPVTAGSAVSSDSDIFSQMMSTSRSKVCLTLMLSLALASKNSKPGAGGRQRHQGCKPPPHPLPPCIQPREVGNLSQLLLPSLKMERAGCAERPDHPAATCPCAHPATPNFPHPAPLGSRQRVYGSVIKTAIAPRRSRLNYTLFFSLGDKSPLLLKQKNYGEGIKPLIKLFVGRWGGEGGGQLTQVLGKLAALLRGDDAFVLHVTLVPHQQDLGVIPGVGLDLGGPSGKGKREITRDGGQSTEPGGGCP